MVSTSISYPGAPAENGVRAIVLASRYLIEPLSNGQSRLTQIIRSDARYGNDYITILLTKFPFLESSSPEPLSN